MLLDDQEKTHNTAPVRSAASERQKLSRRSWRNWCLLAGVSLLITIGLTTSIPPLLNQGIANIWPWANTELVLLMGLSVSMLTFIGYLTQQQLRLIAVSRRLEALQDEAEERAQRYYSHILGLFNVSRVMGSETSMQGVFDCVVKMCIESFGCQRATLMLLDKKFHMLVVKSTCGDSDRLPLVGTRQKVGDGFAGWVAEHREPLLINSAWDDTRYPGLKLEDTSLSSSMVVPIIVHDELLGVLNASSKSSTVEFDEQDLRVLWMFAESAGTYLRYMEATNNTVDTTGKVHDEQGV